MDRTEVARMMEKKIWLPWVDSGGKKKTSYSKSRRLGKEILMKRSVKA